MKNTEKIEDTENTENVQMKVIARIYTDFPSKFGIPRQSGIVSELKGKIIFEPEFRSMESVRGLEGFSHLWLIWQFSAAVRKEWSPMVKPPRLGGQKRMGVFATRSPFRPNNIGLSSLKLEKISYDVKTGPVLHVSGIDMMDGTPVFDIKPYLAYTDSHQEATGGFADDYKEYSLEVIFPEEMLSLIPEDKREAAIGVLAHDPRPSYHNSPERRYGVEFAGYDIRFTVDNGVLTVFEVVEVVESIN